MTKERENTILEIATMAWAEYERLLADSADATGDKATGLIWASDAMKQFTLRLREMAGE